MAGLPLILCTERPRAPPRTNSPAGFRRPVPLTLTCLAVVFAVGPALATSTTTVELEQPRIRLQAPLGQLVVDDDLNAGRELALKPGLPVAYGFRSAPGQRAKRCNAAKGGDDFAE